MNFLLTQIDSEPPASALPATVRVALRVAMEAQLSCSAGGRWRIPRVPKTARAIVLGPAPDGVTLALRLAGFQLMRKVKSGPRKGLEVWGYRP